MRSSLRTRANRVEKLLTVAPTRSLEPVKARGNPAAWRWGFPPETEGKGQGAVIVWTLAEAEEGGDVHCEPLPNGGRLDER